MNVAGFVIMVLAMVGVGISAANHGKEKDGTHNIWIDLASTVIWIALLYYAGAFNGIFM